MFDSAAMCCFLEPKKNINSGVLREKEAVEFIPIVAQDWPKTIQPHSLHRVPLKHPCCLSHRAIFRPKNNSILEESEELHSKRRIQ